MAIKYECDRCNIQTSDKDEIGSVDFPALNFSKKEINGQTRKELCIRCINELIEFMKPLPK